MNTPHICMVVRGIATDGGSASTVLAITLEDWAAWKKEYNHDLAAMAPHLVRLKRANIGFCPTAVRFYRADPLIITIPGTSIEVLRITQESDHSPVLQLYGNAPAEPNTALKMHDSGIIRIAA